MFSGPIIRLKLYELVQKHSVYRVDEYGLEPVIY